MNKRLAAKNIKVQFTEKVKDYLGQKGYDPSFGARPLKRLIQNQVLDKLAMMIIEGEIKTGRQITIDVDHGKVVIK